MVQQRKANLHKQGVIPEFIKIVDEYQIYTAFTQANLKNSILNHRQAYHMSQIKDKEIRQINESQLKEDIVLIQFKLVNKQSFKSVNTLSFINVPLSKQSDPNIQTLNEILVKFQKGQAKKPSLRMDFIPYNKSILTRVISQQLQARNILVMSHFSKKSLTTSFKFGSGPAKNIFQAIDLLFTDSIIKKKLNREQALTLL